MRASSVRLVLAVTCALLVATSASAQNLTTEREEKLCLPEEVPSSWL
jgi:hypothetical protein